MGDVVHKIGKKAVVVGAGIAGLTAARTLADYFERVLILERDTLPPSAAQRHGTTQDRHLHTLIGGGLRSLKELFPGFENDLINVGAVPLRIGQDVVAERAGIDPLPQRDLGLIQYSLSRPLLEFLVRQRIKQYSNISLRERCRVQEILTTSERGATGRVSAVRYEDAEGTSEIVQADFVVDASGRGELTLAVLESLGLPCPELTAIEINMSYGTATFSIPDDAPVDWKGMVTFSNPPQDTLGGIVLPIEGKRWVVALVERAGNKVPGEWTEYMAFAKRLRTPTIYNAIKNAKREGEIVRHGFPASQRRHFERLEIFPDGLICSSSDLI